MDLLFMGITDIIIVLFVIIFLILGAKKGILQKVLDFASSLVSLILSFFFCGQFRDMLISKGLIYPSIHSNIMQNLQQTEAFKDPNATLGTFLNELGLPEFITKFISDSAAIDAQSIANNIATGLSTLLMSIISFFILFVGIFILSKVAKLIVHLLRESVSLLKILDGIVGFLVYGIFAILTVYVLLFIVSILIQLPALESFKNFMMVDMQLNTEKFRLSKYLYEHNLIMNLLGLFM